MTIDFGGVGGQVDRTVSSLRPLRRLLSETQRCLANADQLPLPFLQKAVDRLERACTEDARRAVPDLVEVVSDTRAELGRVSQAREDVDRRRQDLAREAKHRGWPASHTASADHIGPFEVHHSNQVARIRMGSLPIAAVQRPGAAQLISLLESTKATLHRQALEGWGAFVHSLDVAQREISASEPVPWKELIERAFPDKKARQAKQKVNFYRLAMLISGVAPEGWAVATASPVLAEQRSAFDVPRLDQPGQIVRVNRVRLVRL